MKHGQQRVLLVEDDEAVRKVIRRILESASFEVEEARDGAEALKRWAPTKFALVITDLDMPSMSGQELVLTLLSIDRTVRFLIITGRPQSFPEGWACLAKPFLAKELLEIVRGLTC